MSPTGKSLELARCGRVSRAPSPTSTPLTWRFSGTEIESLLERLSPTEPLPPRPTSASLRPSLEAALRDGG